MQLMTGRVDKIMHGERPVEAAAEQFARNFNLVSNRTRLKFSEYLPYLINRVGWLLVIDFGQNTLAKHQLSIAMWRVLAVLAEHDGQRQIDLVPRRHPDGENGARYPHPIRDQQPRSDRVPDAEGVDDPGPRDPARNRARGKNDLGGSGKRPERRQAQPAAEDRKSTRLNSSHSSISYAVFCLKKKNKR